MTDLIRENLYRAVLENPDLEAPRLALADWLETRGDPQGQFIRLEIDAANHPNRYGNQDYARLRNAARDLLAQHGEAWARDTARFASEVRFHRGMPEAVTIDAKQFLDQAGDLFRTAPIRHVAFTDARLVIKELAASPHLDRLVSIGLRKNDLHDSDVAAFVASPHLTRLKSLDLSFNRLGLLAIEALAAASKELSGLVHVNLVGNNVENPVETFATHWSTGAVDANSVSLPQPGRDLEAKFGYQPWLHGPSLISNYPPTEADL